MNPEIISIEVFENMGFSPASIEAAMKAANNNTGAVLDLLISGSFETPLSTSEELSTLGGWSEQLTILKISQYSFPNGRSACTAIATITLADILRRLDEGESPSIIHNETKLSEYLIQGANEYESVRSYSTSQVEHLSVDEFFALTESLWTKLRAVSSTQANLKERNALSKLFDSAVVSGDSTKHIGIILTKPPETMFVILPPSRQPNGIYYLFDSHSRPSLGIDGAYLFSSSNLQDIVERCNLLFPVVDFDDGESLMQEDMYNSIEANSFQSF
jgi:hypothetical protein